jgi:hypothetical protein
MTPSPTPHPHPEPDATASASGEPAALPAVGYAIRSSDQFCWADNRTGRPFAKTWRAVVYADDAQARIDSLTHELEVSRGVGKNLFDCSQELLAQVDSLTAEVTRLDGLAEARKRLAIECDRLKMAANAERDAWRNEHKNAATRAEDLWRKNHEARAELSALQAAHRSPSNPETVLQITDPLEDDRHPQGHGNRAAHREASPLTDEGIRIAMTGHPKGHVTETVRAIVRDVERAHGIGSTSSTGEKHGD